MLLTIEIPLLTGRILAIEVKGFFFMRTLMIPNHMDEQYSTSSPRITLGQYLQRSREGLLHGLKMEGVGGVCAHSKSY